MKADVLQDQNENIRRLGENDLAGVMHLQQSAYEPALHEGETVFRNKQSLFPEGAFGCFLNNKLEAYIFVHPWGVNQPAPLNREIALPESPDCIYIHDLAISPACRRRGIANKLLHEIFRIGDNFSLSKYALVAVQSSEAFWMHIGFNPAKTMQYGGVAATYMLLDRGRLSF